MGDQTPLDSDQGSLASCERLLTLGEEGGDNARDTARALGLQFVAADSLSPCRGRSPQLGQTGFHIATGGARGQALGLHQSLLWHVLSGHQSYARTCRSIEPSGAEQFSFLTSRNKPCNSSKSEAA